MEANFGWVHNVVPNFWTWWWWETDFGWVHSVVLYLLLAGLTNRSHYCQDFALSYNLLAPLAVL